MATKSNEANRKLALKRETLRRINAVDLVQVAGGYGTHRCGTYGADTFSRTSYGC